MNFENKIINRKWRIIKKITLEAPKKYLAKDLTNGNFVCLKISDEKTKEYIENEAMILEKLKKDGFPKIIWHGKDYLLNNYTFLITNQLGPSIYELFLLCKKKFSLKTVLMIGILSVDILEYLHSQNFIHKNINPYNFFIGINEKSKNIILANYQYSEKYKDDEIGFHKGLKENDEFVSNNLFSSIRADLLMNSSRRDDFESLGYMLVYFLKGELPWENFGSENYGSIEEYKNETLIEKICENLDFEFSLLLNYFRNLGFREKPNYAFIKETMVRLFNEKKFVFDYKYDWVKSKNLKINSKSQEKEFPIVSFEEIKKLSSMDQYIKTNDYKKSKFAKKFLSIIKKI